MSNTAGITSEDDDGHPSSSILSHSKEEKRVNEDEEKPSKTNLSSSSSSDSLLLLTSASTSSNSSDSAVLPSRTAHNPASVPNANHLDPSQPSSILHQFTITTNSSSSFVVPPCSLPQLAATAHKPTKTISHDEHIFNKINLKDTKSINRFFKFEKGKGTLKPIASYVGCSANFRQCFKKIREWRRLTRKQQDKEKERFQKLHRNQKDKFRKNIDDMIAARDGSKDNEDNDCNDSRRLTGYSGKGREVEDEPGENGNNPAPVRSRMSDRTLVQRAKKMSEQLHEKVLAHIGFASSKEERVRKINEDEENNKGGRVMKKRKKGERPQYLYQAGDKVGRKSFFDALKCFGVFSDSTTIERNDENEMNLNEEEGPRNMAVMMVLNEVSDSSMNGGGAREKCQAKRSKPQFFWYLIINQTVSRF